jgi:iron-sulfur cluster repair protein YtfE (RIC family)
MSDLKLETRLGLPDAMRVLLAEYPREAWAADPHFAGLVAFWLQMHQGFRDAIAAMTGDAEAVLDGTLERAAFAPRLSRVGGQFVEHLHGHHHIEDDHYFPLLVARERRLEQGFQILDADHQALDGHIVDFVGGANGVLRAVATNAGAFRDEAGAFHAQLVTFSGFLERHLADEEELIVPVILKYGERGI